MPPIVGFTSGTSSRRRVFRTLGGGAPRRGDFFVACERPRFRDLQQPQRLFSLPAVAQQLRHLRQQFLYLLTSPPPLFLKRPLSLGLHAAMRVTAKKEGTSRASDEFNHTTQHVLSATTAALLLHSPPSPSLLQQQRIIEMLVDASTFLRPPPPSPVCITPPSACLRDKERPGEGSLNQSVGGGRVHDTELLHDQDSLSCANGGKTTEDSSTGKSSSLPHTQATPGCRQGQQQHQNALSWSRAEACRGSEDGGGAVPLTFPSTHLPGKANAVFTSSVEAAAWLPQAQSGDTSRHLYSGTEEGSCCNDGGRDPYRLLGSTLLRSSSISSRCRSSLSIVQRECFCPVCFGREGGRMSSFAAAPSSASTIVQCVVTILRLLEGGDPRTEDVGFWSWLLAFALLERFQWTQQQTVRHREIFEEERKRADVMEMLKMKVQKDNQQGATRSGGSCPPCMATASANVDEQGAKASSPMKGREIEGCQKTQSRHDEEEKKIDGEAQEARIDGYKDRCLNSCCGGRNVGREVKGEEEEEPKRLVTHRNSPREASCSSRSCGFPSSSTVGAASVRLTDERRVEESERQRSLSEQKASSGQAEHRTLAPGRRFLEHATATRSRGTSVDVFNNSSPSRSDGLHSPHFPPSSSPRPPPRSVCKDKKTAQRESSPPEPHVYFLCTPVIPPSALWLVERLLLLLTRCWREAVKCRPIIRMLVAVFAAPLLAGRILDVSSPCSGALNVSHQIHYGRTCATWYSGRSSSLLSHASTSLRCKGGIRANGLTMTRSFCLRMIAASQIGCVWPSSPSPLPK